MADGQHPPDGAVRGQHRAAQVHRDGLPPLLRVSQPQWPPGHRRFRAGDHQLRCTEVGINADESGLYLPAGVTSAAKRTRRSADPSASRRNAPVNVQHHGRDVEPRYSASG